MDFVIGNKGAVNANRQAGARRHVEHVTVAQQLLGATLVNDGARVDLAGDLERHARRNVGLDQAGDHVHRRPLCREDQVDTRRPRLLGDTGDQLFNLLADDHHHVGKFIDHHHDGRQLGQQWCFIVNAFALVQRVSQRCAGVLGFLDLGIEARQVTHAHLRHQLVAALHLGNAPAQGIGGVLHVGDHRAQQVRDAFVDRQFQHLRVDHDQLGVIRPGLEQDRQDHGVHTHRLTGTGGTGHEQVRHFRQVGNHRLAADVMTERQGDRRFEVVVFRGRQHFGEPYDLPVFVGNLDTHGGLARDHFHHTHAGHGQGTRQVFGQVGNAADFYPGGRLDFVTGNHRARMDRVHRHFDAEFLELDFQQVADGRQGFGGIVELFLFGRVQNRDRRQGAFDGAVDKQRRLFLFLHAMAGLRRLGRCRGDHGRHLLFTVRHVLAQGLLALDQALLDLGLLASIRRAWGHHLVDAGVHFTQLRHHLLALDTGGPPAVGGALEQFEQVEGDLAGHVHHLEP